MKSLDLSAISGGTLCVVSVCLNTFLEKLVWLFYILAHHYICYFFFLLDVFSHQ